MSLGNEAKDPWGWLLAAFSGGLTWAVMGSPAGVVAGIGVGVAVYGTKVAAGGLMGRDRELERRSRQRGDALPSPPRNSPAAIYVQRAVAANSRMADMADRPGDAWLRTEVGRMDDGAEDVVRSLRDLAGRVTLADQVIAAGDGPALTADRAAIVAQLAGQPDPALTVERQRALAAVDDQLAALNRLAGVREQLLVRMQTTAVGLETLATRMGEVVTLGSAAYEHDRAGELLAQADSDLEALRTGLAEAQALTRGVI